LYLLNSKHVISHIVFTITIIVLSFSLLSIIFPALITTLSSPNEQKLVDPLELGAFALPFILTSSVFFLIIFLIQFSRNEKLAKFKKFFLEFDISKKTTFLILSGLIGLYLISIYADFNTPEITEYQDFRIVANEIRNWPPNSFTEFVSENFVRFFFLYESHYLLGNIRIIPVLASISLIIVTYQFTLKLSNKRISGIIASTILIQSTLFTTFSSTATYTNFWVLFYLLSLYVISNKWQLSAPIFLLSVFSKPLTILYIPLTIFFIFKSNLKKQTKLKLTITFIVLLAIFFVVLVYFSSDVELFDSYISFHPVRFWTGFTVLTNSLLQDPLILSFCLPLTYLLYQKSKQGHIHADSILIFLFGMVISSVLLTGFANYQINPYRFVPFVVFFAIGVGLIFSKAKQE